MGAFISGAIWDNGAGGAQTLNAAYDVGETIDIGEKNGLIVNATIAVAAPTTLHILPEYSLDEGATWIVGYLGVIDDSGVITHKEVEIQLAGFTGTKAFGLIFPEESKVRISAKRTGGPGATLLMQAYARDQEEAIPYMVGVQSTTLGMVQGGDAVGTTPTTNPFVAAGVYEAAPSAVADTQLKRLLIDANGRLQIRAQGDTSHDAVDAGDPVKTGGVYKAAPGTVQDLDRAEFLTDNIGQQRVATDAMYLLGSSLITGGATGVFAFGGPSAQGATATGNPVQVGSVYRSTPPTLTNGQGGGFWIDSKARIGSIAFGDVADDAADSSEAPVKIGGRAYQTLVVVSDPLDRVHAAFDMYRRLHVRPASYNELLDALRASVNTIANDYSVSPDTWIDATNVAAGPLYYPNSDGFVIGTQTFLAITFEIEDGAMKFEVSNGNNWVEATAMMVWTANGDAGWADTDFTEPGSGTPVDFAVTWDHIRFEKIRMAFTRSDPANTVRIDAMYGAN